ncbi:MAG: hypothetical protein KA965_07490 [Butyrivibrio sp.]|nr:hypothetical protein [Butyrivibrio sp.]
MKEVELYRTDDMKKKEHLLNMLIRERISYLEKQEKIPILKRKEYNGNQIMYIICVDEMQKDAADVILKGFDIA